MIGSTFFVCVYSYYSICYIGGLAHIQTIVKNYPRSCQHIGYNGSYCCINPLSKVVNGGLFLQVHNIFEISLKIKIFWCHVWVSWWLRDRPCPSKATCLGIKRLRLHGRGCCSTLERLPAERKVILVFFIIILPWKYIKVLHVTVSLAISFVLFATKSSPGYGRALLCSNYSVWVNIRFTDFMWWLWLRSSTVRSSNENCRLTCKNYMLPNRNTWYAGKNVLKACL